ALARDARLRCAPPRAARGRRGEELAAHRAARPSRGGGLPDRAAAAERRSPRASRRPGGRGRGRARAAARRNRRETLSRVGTGKRAWSAPGSCGGRAAAGEAGAANLKTDLGQSACAANVYSSVMRSRSVKSAAPASPAAARRPPGEPGGTLAVRPRAETESRVGSYGRGTRTSIRTPLSELTITVPPSACTRSRMPTRP